MCPHVSAANHPYLEALWMIESDRTTWQHCSRPVPKSPEPRPSLPGLNTLLYGRTDNLASKVGHLSKEQQCSLQLDVIIFLSQEAIQAEMDQNVQNVPKISYDYINTYMVMKIPITRRPITKLDSLQSYLSQLRNRLLSLTLDVSRLRLVGLSAGVDEKGRGSALSYIFGVRNILIQVNKSAYKLSYGQAMTVIHSAQGGGGGVSHSEISSQN
ncbi:hypothetical protein J6590_036544 [Homalodisca vitripennis]|nr:hypothetical protein J6590_036544 [Homalodisca vitripennis]